MLDQSRKDPATLPGNVNKNLNIQALREEWKCSKSDATCPGTYCFVDPETAIHLPLSNERFDCWASAMVSLTSLFDDKHIFIKYIKAQR